MVPNGRGPFEDENSSSPLSSCCSDPGGLEVPKTDLQRYCICRRLDEGLMIGCDGGCDDWFHIRCVGITEKEQDVIEKYVCPQCTESGNGKTIWKAGVARAVSKLATSTLLAEEALLKLSEEAAIREEEAAVRKAIKDANQQPENREATNEAEKAKRAPIIRHTARNARLAARRTRIVTPLKTILKKPSFKPQTRSRHSDGGALLKLAFGLSPTAAAVTSILKKAKPQMGFDADMELVLDRSKSRASGTPAEAIVKKKPQTRYSDGGTQLRSKTLRSKARSTRSQYRDFNEDAQTPAKTAEDELSPERMPSAKQTPLFAGEDENIDPEEKKVAAEEVDLEAMEQTYTYKLVKKAMLDALFGN